MPDYYYKLLQLLLVHNIIQKRKKEKEVIKREIELLKREREILQMENKLLKRVMQNLASIHENYPSDGDDMAFSMLKEFLTDCDGEEYVDIWIAQLENLQTE